MAASPSAIPDRSPVLQIIFRALLVFAFASGGTHAAIAQRSQAAPEGASPRAERSLQRARTFMVSAANPLAVEAGIEMLRAGGSAADAGVGVAGLPCGRRAEQREGGGGLTAAGH